MEFLFGGFGSFGTIGFVYYSIGGWFLAHILFFAMVILSIVGAITTIKWLCNRKNRKMDPHEKWLRTGKMD